MKKIKLFIIAFSAILLTASCSNNKQIQESTTWKQRYEALEADYTDLQQWKTTWEQRYSSLAEANGKLRTEKLAYAGQPKPAEVKDVPAQPVMSPELASVITEHQKAVSNLKNEVAGAMKEFTAEEMKINVQDGRLYVSMYDKLLFPSGSDDVDKRGREAVVALAKVLLKNDAQVTIEGHTDKVPIHNARNKDNWDLSLHRAASVTRILTENGVSPDRIIASGRGEYHPLAENETNEGRVQNRRTEIILAPNTSDLWKLIGNDQSLGMLK
jgi:chemotaxis protein MotB